jgi:hypothetical protein
MRAEPRAEHDEASFDSAKLLFCFALCLLQKATEAGEPTQGSGGVNGAKSKS